MSELWNYWKENIKIAKTGHGIVTVILGCIAILIWPIFRIVGLNGSTENIVGMVFSYGGIVTCIIWALIWLPAKRHEEHEIKSKKIVEDLIIADGKAFNYIKSEHAKEIENLHGEIKLLKGEKEKNSQVNVTSAMVMENTSGINALGQPNIPEKLVLIKVVNNTDKIIRVDKVVIRLVPATEIENGIPAIRADRFVRANPVGMMQIQPDGDALIWKYKINQKIEIQTYQKNGGFCGKGMVILLDERQFDFEFEIF